MQYIVHKFILFSSLLGVLVFLWVCATPQDPDPLFEFYQPPQISSSPTQVGTTSSSDFTLSYGTEPSTSTETTTSTEESSSTVETSSTIVDVLEDVVDFMVAFNSDTARNVLTWTVPDTSFYKGAMIRVNTYQLGDPNATFPTTPTDGVQVADVGLDETPNNQCYHQSSVPCPPDPTNVYYYTIFAYDESGNYTKGVSKLVVPQDLNPTVPVPSADAVFDQPNNRILVDWSNPSGDFLRTMVRYSTSSYPSNTTTGTHLGTYDEATTDAILGSPSHGSIYYFSFFAEDCHENYADPTFAEVTIPIDPITDLQAFPGPERIFLKWTAASGAAEYHIRYNTTGTTINSVDDGMPVRTIGYPDNPGVIPATAVTLEHHLDENGDPLTEKTYFYTVFAESADGVLSDGVMIPIYLSSVTVEFFDDFEGSHDFCTTYDVYDSWQVFMLFGILHNPNYAFSGSYSAFNHAMQEPSGVCEDAFSLYSKDNLEAANTWLSLTLDSTDLSVYSQVILTYRYNYKSSYNCEQHHPSGYTRVWANVTGSIASDTDIVLTDTYMNTNSWTGWELMVVDITPYKSVNQTTIGWQTYKNYDSDWGVQSCNGGLYLDEIRIYGIN
jgi:hypothetical protein